VRISNLSLFLLQLSSRC